MERNFTYNTRIPFGSWKKFPSTDDNCVNKNNNQINSASSSPITVVLRNNCASARKSKFPGILHSIGKNRHRKPPFAEGNTIIARKCIEHSFEINQSFPRPTRNHRLLNYEIDFVTPLKKRLNEMDKIRVDGANGIRFSVRRKGCFTPGTGSPFSNSFAASASESLLRVPQNGINPNKAVFTIDSKTSQILIVNKQACELLGYTPKELCDMQFSILLTNKNKSHVSALAEGQLNSEDGTMVLLSGKVVEMNTKYGTKVAVSLWIRQIDIDGRCLAVAEPVERRVAQILIDRNGCILSADYDALMLFQLDSLEQFCGMDIQSLIPAIQLPDSDSSLIAKHVRKQKATGKTSDGISFPLCLMIGQQDTGTDTTDSGVSNSHLYVITIWVFQNISGLIVIDEMGVIESCNHHFSTLMFGYSQNKILGLHITQLIPHFGQETEYLGYARSRNATTSSLDVEESETETDPVYLENESYIASSTNPIDLAKATSEPVKIGLRSSVSDAPTECQSAPVQTDAEQQETKMIFKSISENHLGQENCENNKNVANVSSSSVKALNDSNLQSSGKPLNGILFNEKDTNAAAETDADVPDGELLTPVNETYSPIVSSGGIVDCCVDLKTNSRQIESPRNSFSATPPPQSNQQRFTDGESSNQQLITSTPDVRRVSMHIPSGISASTSVDKAINYTDGKYKGEAIHCDDNVIDILYTISSQTLPCGRKVFCVWICRDPDTEYDIDDDDKQQNLTLTFNSINSTIESSLGQAIKYTAAQNSSRPNSVSLMSQCEDDQINGEYNKYYTTLKQIGKGAYGYVKMAFRHSDRLLVVTKFILKDKLTPQFMIQSEDKKDIPMEIYLLTTVNHPNIVTVLDVFENDKFFQLVMEKHGSGMDLFEFIDRRPMMDEKLGCYIFRQIANAVDYLHSLHILHRDIKDENIIIDQTFHVKLIDFGSATFMEDGKLFSTFYGTTEYCSPEVLAGNRYAGPELEMWSLGVTLYVLMFFENPFLDIEETLRANLTMPHHVSATLETLLYSMLDKNPKTRCTMRQLMTNNWIMQDINASNFNFNWIVPCEAHESNPEKYFTGQIYSSTTGLSTASPQDSLSLVDEDSIIDADDGVLADVNNDDEGDDDEKSIPSQDEQICDKCAPAVVYCQSKKLPNTNSSIADKSTTSMPYRTNLQQTKDAPARSYDHPGKLVVNNIPKSTTSNSRCLTVKCSNNAIINMYSSSVTNCTQCVCPPIINTTNITAIATTTIITTNTITSTVGSNIKINSINNLPSMLPVTLNKTPLLSNDCTDLCVQCQNSDDDKFFTISSFNKSPSTVHRSYKKLKSFDDIEDTDYDGDASELSDSPPAFMFSKSSSDFREMFHDTPNETQNTKNSDKSMGLNIELNMCALSKSETNLFKNLTDDGNAISKLSIFNVVSLNDLSDDINPLAPKQMNDLSKNQYLNNISNDDVTGNCTSDGLKQQTIRK